MKRNAILRALSIAIITAGPCVAQAQGTVRGAEEGAARGNEAAGPIGGIVGGAVGAVTGTVGGILGVEPSREREIVIVPAEPRREREIVVVPAEPRRERGIEIRERERPDHTPLKAKWRANRAPPNAAVILPVRCVLPGLGLRQSLKEDLWRVYWWWRTI